jgi:hypothetical protein
VGEYDLALARIRNTEKFFLETSLHIEARSARFLDSPSNLQVSQSAFESRRPSDPSALRHTGRLRVSDTKRDVHDQKLGKIRWIANQSKVTSV